MERFGGAWNDCISDDDQLDWCELENAAKAAEVRPVYIFLRCQHGRSRRETCIPCENGYVDDMHPFGNPRGPVSYWASSYDGETIAYIPARYRTRVEKAMVKAIK